MNYTFYQVKAGDQLYRILRDHYGNQAFLKDRAQLVELIRSNNPQIVDIDKIRRDQVIMLPDLDLAGGGKLPVAPAYDTADTSQLADGLSALDPGAKDFMGGLNLKEAYSGATGSFMNLAEKATRDAKPQMDKIALSYFRSKAGTLTTNQYNYQRALRVQALDEQMGVLHQLINPGRRVGEVLRIDRSAANRAHKILKESQKLSRIAKNVSRGNVVLAAISIGATIVEYQAANTAKERRAIVGGTAGSLVAGVGVTLAIAAMATPVGWVGFIVVLGAGAAASMAGDGLGRWIAEQPMFDGDGQEITYPGARR